QALRDVADMFGIGPAVIVAAVKLDAARVGHLLDQGAEQGAFARAVEANQRRDALVRQPGVDAAQDGVAAQRNVQVLDGHQIMAHGSAFARLSRFCRIFFSYQSLFFSSFPSSFSSLGSAVSSGSTTTSCKPFTSFCSTSADDPLGYCGSTAMTRTSLSL